MNFSPGERIGDYELRSFCGGGAYGEVFSAVNTLTGERVALKILHRAPKILERELRGVLHYRDCRNVHLIRIRHVEQFRESLYYTMDLADDLNRGSGEYLPDTLANRLARQHRLDSETVSALADAITEGLKALHSRGLVHRDVKPDNILWINRVPVLGDAGLTADVRRNSLVGTPEFMPAELLRHEREMCPADDFYALTRVLYCAFTGDAPTTYPSCPKGLLNAKNSALWRRILEHGETRPAPKPRRKHLIWISAATIGAILVALSGAALLFSSARRPAPPAGDGISMPLDEKRIAADQRRGIRFSVDRRVLVAYNRDLRDAEYIIPDGVTAIENEAFSHSLFTRVRIPDSVTTIGEGAFMDCALISVTIPRGVTVISDGAFAACTKLRSVTIPDGVTRIGDYAFRKCRSLTVLKLPRSVRSVGEHAFDGSPCAAQVRRDYPHLFAARTPKVEFSRGNSILVRYHSENPDREYTIPAGVTLIGDRAFEGCRHLVRVTIPDGVTKIGYFAFRGCENLAEATIPGSVDTICTNAFENCTGLTSVTISDGVRVIGAQAFSGCVSLTRAVIPDSVRTIGRGAFAGCGNLTEVVLPSGGVNIYPGAFSGTPCEERLKRDHRDMFFQ